MKYLDTTPPKAYPHTAPVFSLSCDEGAGKGWGGGGPISNNQRVSQISASSPLPSPPLRREGASAPEYSRAVSEYGPLLTAADNIALDETLLDACENGTEGEILRVWESPETFVVLGYSNQAAKEIDLDACKAHRVKVLKRCSGGGTVLQGPGCLSYALILKISAEPALQTISGANRFIMERHRKMMENLTGKAVDIEGHTDLAIEGRKFSGNAQRRRKKTLLFHGTFLLDFDFSQMETFLKFPSKKPDYRQERSHGEFLMNLKLDAETVKAALRREWRAK